MGEIITDPDEGVLLDVIIYVSHRTRPCEDMRGAGEFEEEQWVATEL